MQVVDIAEWVASRRSARAKNAAKRHRLTEGLAARRGPERCAPRAPTPSEAADPIAHRHRPE